MDPRSRRLPAAVAVLVAGSLLTITAQSPRVTTIRTTPEQRKAYLAHAAIWHEPEPLSATDILEGPQGAFPYTFEQANTREGVGCTFLEPGRNLGGKSPKFLCLADDRKTLRLKYWDSHLDSGNREVFATVAAARLMWALGFVAVPVMTVNLHCRTCPANPMTGQGVVADRSYVALMASVLAKPLIISSEDNDQGWSWKELNDAIDALPPGEEKIRQRTHLDALALLGVLIQHGDRKPEQQALYCDGDVSPEAGLVRPVKDKAGDAVLTEQKGKSACANPAVAVVDIGSTFGGGGKLSKQSTAKMNLQEWSAKPVFKETGTTECRGNLIVSMTAGAHGRPDPGISEEGRSFLAEKLHRLTPDHLRALFKGARVDELASNEDARPDAAAADPIQAWVDVFQEKVKQIDARRCTSLTSGS